MGNYKMFKLDKDETKELLTWALRQAGGDVILTYLDLPKAVVKEAEALEDVVYKELLEVTTQVIEKYGVDVKYYHVVDRQRVRNIALVITLIKRGEGVILDLTHAEHMYMFRKACREGVLRTPCQFI